MVIKRIVNILLLLFLSNFLALINMYPSFMTWGIVLACLTFIFFIVYNINPRFKKKISEREEVLMGGRELIIDSFFVLILDLCFLYLLLFKLKSLSVPIIIINEIISLILLIISMFNGILRFIFGSTQLSAIMRVLLFFTWWIPILNLFICGRASRVTKRECRYIIEKAELNNSRKENEVCKTKYPLLLVHGIFWRDWQFFNYWGRIHNELIRNGAVVYYGNQQSAATMEVGGEELKNQILNIIEKENCEKVNIIAHSKGGLDARYVISKMGMDKYVASLTTIGTPHHGCMIVDKIIKAVPDSFVQFVARKYNKMYKKLGDTNPDFYSGIMDLTVTKCEQFNKEVLDKENVLYQSVASKMSKASSAGFPLNLGFSLLKHTDGDNDGFVAVNSSKWGEFLGCYETKRKRGVSHGDTIDLMRENIKGFDVCECYVDIIKGLKEKGL